VAIGSELWGEKWVDPKPLSTMPAIVCGHSPRSHTERDNEEELAPEP
jgi:hypothetical protein